MRGLNGSAYALDDMPVVGFDNERVKGDHCHIQDSERQYIFTAVEQLFEDFNAAVDAARIET